MMPITESDLSVEERLVLLLQHLGIQRAHFAARVTRDWNGFVTTHLESVSSLTLVCPQPFDSHVPGHLASRLLVLTGDQGRPAELVRRSTTSLTGANFHTLNDYPVFPWSDPAADRTDEIGSAMMEFLEYVDRTKGVETVDLPESEGNVADISYRVQGSGPPLVLLPLLLAHSQWEPLLFRLSQRYCTIVLSGAEVGFVVTLETRGRSTGYLGVVQKLIDEAHLRPGDSVLDVGCGTGVLDRWLVRNTGGANKIVALDISPYLLREATALARREGMEGVIEFQEGNAEALPFPDNSFDVAMSCTVMGEGDAERILAELIRVIKPGGRVAAIVRAVDMWRPVNLPLRADLKAKIEAPGSFGAGVEDRGCSDASLYRRFQQAGLAQVRMLPQLAVYVERPTLQWQQELILGTLTPNEVIEWQGAVSDAEAEGTFFITQPFHCAVGTKL